MSRFKLFKPKTPTDIKKTTLLYKKANSKQHYVKSFLFSFFTLSLLLLAVYTASAHETWILTPQQIAEWNAKAKPLIFTQMTSTNLAILMGTGLFLIAWILLNFTGARELFPDLQIRLASYGNLVSVILRISMAITLLMAGFALNPHFSLPHFEAPTFIAPDLELRTLSPNWAWLAWTEIGMGITLWLGVYVRLTAVLLMATTFLGMYLFGILKVLPYAGFVLGIGTYLLLQGPGAYYIPLPTPKKAKRLVTWLTNQSRQRAQFLLRIFSGFSLMYAGIAYKVLQPNLFLAVIALHDIPTHVEVTTFVFLAAVVETMAGILLIAGILLRPMSLFLFLCFLFFTITFGESIFAHIMILGVLVTCIINSGGRWKRPIATDKRAKIVILGATFGGIHCAIKLDRLLGEVSNVSVTLIHDECYFQFDPLLPEVIGGAVQPRSIANPIRCICRQAQFVYGKVQAIDHVNQKVNVTLSNGEIKKIRYDQLVVALGREADFAGIPGLLEHASPIMNIGDALTLRKAILDRLEEASALKDAEQRKSLLTFSVIGAGLRGSATAAEICALLHSALAVYPKIQPQETQVLLFEKPPEIVPQFSPFIAKAAYRRLIKAGVKVHKEVPIQAITSQGILLSSGQRIPSSTIVCALSKRPTILRTLPDVAPDGRIKTNHFLQCETAPNIFVTGDCTSLSSQYPFLPLRETHMGRTAAYNAWAQSQGFALKIWRNKKPLSYIVTLGRTASVGKLFGIPIQGFFAWFFSHLVCLLTMPGLERNLRILIDWFLDSLFRDDIAIIAPKTTTKLQRAHYEIGDEIIRQGEVGNCAYILVSGTVNVLKTTDGQVKQVATLEQGECFGEIALLAGTLRTATIKCATPVDVIIIPRDQFFPLLAGFKELENLLTGKMIARLNASAKKIQ